MCFHPRSSPSHPLRASRSRERDWKDNENRLQLAHETLLLWLDYAKLQSHELGHYDKFLSSSLSHRVCGDNPGSNPGPRDTVASATVLKEWQNASSPLFVSHGSAFAELLRAKLEAGRKNREQVEFWAGRIEKRAAGLKKELDRLKEEFNKIFPVFEQKRNEMAKQYLDVKKSKEIFSACELELKLASKGSISAATLSDKMLKMNAARDKCVSTADICRDCRWCLLFCNI